VASASASAALAGRRELAELLFGLGLVSWIVLGSIIFGRLVLGPPLPAAPTPTTAIEVAPAGAATFAAFVFDGPP
jgi:tellurite resistance protein